MKDAAAAEVHRGGRACAGSTKDVYDLGKGAVEMVHRDSEKVSKYGCSGVPFLDEKF